ncbi:MAG: uroporphyrinogen decarboxylase family protein [Desulfitobacteriaceae bacterium]|nr:uroporphyrinogen decarboxylase family protein [Desulfitobacteriaceae bacterium]MDD4752764.1 uroporphyrinogen decarboxylase family protein [Desulfitobacteriaceae bacterium]
MQTGRERVWTALRGMPSDRRPKGEILITEELIKKNSQPGLEQMLEFLDADLVTFPISQETGPWKEWSQKPYFLFGLFQGPFTLMSEKLGWNEMLHQLVQNPGETKLIMRTLLEENLPHLFQALEKGCDGVLFADDMAGNQGLFVSPAYLKENYFPLLHGLIEKINSPEIPFIFHSDGKIMGLVTPLKEAGFWGIQGLQPSAGIEPSLFPLDTFADWVFWGNFEFEGLGRLKTVSEVIKDTENVLESWAPFPRYIFSSSGGLYQDLSLPAIKAAYNTVNSFNNLK